MSVPLLALVGDAAQLQEQPVKTLLEKDAAPVNIVSIFGMARTGKSTLQSCLSGADVRSLLPKGTACAPVNDAAPFPVAHRAVPCTKGADILLDVPAGVVCGDGASVAGAPQCALVDVEGQGEEGATYDLALFLPVLMVSKVVLFNLSSRSLQPAETLDGLTRLVQAADRLASTGSTAPKFGHLVLVHRDMQFTDRTDEEATRMLFLADELVSSESAESPSGTHRHAASAAAVERRNRQRQKLRQRFSSLQVVSMRNARYESDLFLEDLGKLQRVLVPLLREPFDLPTRPGMHATGSRLAAILKSAAERVGSLGPEGLLPMSDVFDYIITKEQVARVKQLQKALTDSLPHPPENIDADTPAQALAASSFCTARMHDSMQEMVKASTAAELEAAQLQMTMPRMLKDDVQSAWAAARAALAGQARDASTVLLRWVQAHVRAVVPGMVSSLRGSSTTTDPRSVVEQTLERIMQSFELPVAISIGPVAIEGVDVHAEGTSTLLNALSVVQKKEQVTKCVRDWVQDAVNFQITLDREKALQESMRSLQSDMKNLEDKSAAERAAAERQRAALQKELDAQRQARAALEGRVSNAEQAMKQAQADMREQQERLEQEKQAQAAEHSRRLEEQAEALARERARNEQLDGRLEEMGQALQRTQAQAAQAEQAAAEAQAARAEMEHQQEMEAGQQSVNPLLLWLLFNRAQPVYYY